MYFNYKLYRDIFRFFKMCHTPYTFYWGTKNKIIEILKIIKKIIKMLIIHTKNLSMGYYLCVNFCYENVIKYYKTSSYSFIS